MGRQNRRRFLWTLAGGGGSIALGGLARLTQGNGSPQTSTGSAAHRELKPLKTVKQSSWALGSDISITAVHANDASASRAIGAAFDEIDRVEDVMSIYRPHSQLARLNRDGQLPHPDASLVEVLRTARRVSELSRGAFDITVQPLWLLFRDAQRMGSRPQRDAVLEARAAIDYRRVEVHEDLIRLNGTGTQITLNGIAQGYALDRAAAVLALHGVRQAMFDTGEIGSSGLRADGGAWKAGIQHPRQEDAYVAVVALDGRCLATSGDYATTFSPDYLSNHLFDPRTGRSPTELASVSVLAPVGVLADALSTAVCVLGVDRGRALIAATPNADALFVLKSGRTLATDGFPLESV